MNKVLWSVGAAAVFAGLSVTPAQAQNWYVEAAAGIETQGNLDWEHTSYDMDNGPSYALSVGHPMWGNWDVEAEASYDRMDYSCCTSDTHEYRVMANLTRNFNMGGFEPYAGGGLGVAWVTYAYPGYSTTDTVAAYQIIGGVRVPLGSSWSVYGEYRYQNTFTDAKGDGIDWEHHGNNFQLGVRYALS